MDFNSAFLKKLVKVLFCFAFREISFKFRKISFEFRENFAQISILCLAKILRNWRKILRNTKLIILRNFPENTKQKIFAATLHPAHPPSGAYMTGSNWREI